jgi:glucose/arabinose dehydrogenase
VRWLTVAPNGDVFLSEQGAGKITVLRDANGDGRAELITTFAKGFSQPHGMAFHDGALYIGDVRAIWRIPYRDGDTVAREMPVRVTTAPDLRPKGEHTVREIAFDSKGALYLGIGARADLQEDDPPPDATVQLVARDGSMTTFASGLRNPSALAVYPGTDDLWTTVNERDELGAQLPPDFLARIGKDDFFGWPYAYSGMHPDPKLGAKRPDLVAKSKTPEVLFEAHSAPLGLAFYSHSQFPAEYMGDAFVAFHGSGPYDKPDGYKVVRIRFANGKPTGAYEDFVTGFADEDKPSAKKGMLTQRVWGTPAGLAIAKDGSLLIADDKGKTVWRVSYRGSK